MWKYVLLDGLEYSIPGTWSQRYWATQNKPFGLIGFHSLCCTSMVEVYMLQRTTTRKIIKKSILLQNKWIGMNGILRNPVYARTLAGYIWETETERVRTIGNYICAERCTKCLQFRKYRKNSGMLVCVKQRNAMSWATLACKTSPVHEKEEGINLWLSRL